MPRDATSQITDLSSEQKANEKKLRMYQDKVKALEAKEQFLTKKGRNKFIFSLGLKAEKCIPNAEYLTDEDLDIIFDVAFNAQNVKNLIALFSAENRKSRK
jgi:hypothetical protein